MKIYNMVANTQTSFVQYEVPDIFSIGSMTTIKQSDLIYLQKRIKSNSNLDDQVYIYKNRFSSLGGYVKKNEMSNFLKEIFYNEKTIHFVFQNVSDMSNANLNFYNDDFFPFEAKPKTLEVLKTFNGKAMTPNFTFEAKPVASVLLRPKTFHHINLEVGN